jgi:hypothetical protein
MAEAGATADACVAPTVEGYEPKWMPPKAIPGACTAEQVARQYDVCSNDSGKFDQKACRAFNVDSANSACLGCLFGALGDEQSAAIVVLPQAYWIANVGGCESLLDGDSSETSCGARTQAAGVCQFLACANACTFPVSNTEWKQCLDAARVACSQYGNAASCTSLPRYARCQNATFQDFFLTMGDLFCVSGPPNIDTAAGGAGGSEP